MGFVFLTEQEKICMHINSKLNAYKIEFDCIHFVFCMHTKKSPLPDNKKNDWDATIKVYPNLLSIIRNRLSRSHRESLSEI